MSRPLMHTQKHNDVTATLIQRKCHTKSNERLQRAVWHIHRKLQGQNYNRSGKRPHKSLKPGGFPQFWKYKEVVHLNFRVVLMLEWILCLGSTETSHWLTSYQHSRWSLSLIPELPPFFVQWNPGLKTILIGDHLCFTIIPLLYNHVL